MLHTPCIPASVHLLHHGSRHVAGLITRVGAAAHGGVWVCMWVWHSRLLVHGWSRGWRSAAHGGVWVCMWVWHSRFPVMWLVTVAAGAAEMLVHGGFWDDAVWGRESGHK